MLLVGSASASLIMMRSAAAAVMRSSSAAAAVPVFVELGVAVPRGAVRVQVGRQGEEAQLGEQLKQTSYESG